MADETPKKTRKPTTRAPRKRSASQPGAGPAADTEARGAQGEHRAAETPALAIEHSAEGNGPPSVDEEEIRRQAYELYVSRGGADGGDLSDWLEAERIIRLRRSGPAGPAESGESSRS